MNKLKKLFGLKKKMQVLVAGLAALTIGGLTAVTVQAALRPGLSPEYPGITFWNIDGEQVSSPDKARTYTFDLNVKKASRHPGFKSIPTRNYIGYVPATIDDLKQTDYLRIKTGLESSITLGEEGTHTFETRKKAEIPVGYWVLGWEDSYLCHTNEVTWYEGITFIPSSQVNRGYTYPSAWIAYCADCGRPVFNDLAVKNPDGTLNEIPHVYMTDETVGYTKPVSGVEVNQTAGGVKYLYTNLRSWYRDPYIGHLEQSIDSSHLCKDVSNNRYKVIYINDGNAGASKYSIHTYKNRGTYEGQVASSQANLSINSYVKPGHEFLGWATSAERAAQGIVDYKDGADWQPLFEGAWNENLANEDQVSGSGVRFLYAVWKQSNSTLKIDPAGGTYKGNGAVTNVTQGYGSELKINNSDFKKKGYTVSFVTNTGGVTGTAVNPINTTAEMVGLKYDANSLHGEIDKLTAVKPDYDYKFSGDDKTTDTVTATWNNVPIKLPTAKANGYAFGGWYSNSSLSDASFVGGAGATVTIDRNTTLYAKWIGLGLRAEAQYTTKYNYNGYTTEAGHTDLNWEYPVQNQAITYKIYGGENLSQIQSIASGATNPALLIGTKSDKALTSNVDSGKLYTSGIYEVPHDGYYNIYLGGAQGGNTDLANGGFGGTMEYSKVYLSKGTKLEYKVGKQGGYESHKYRGANGGGSTTLKVNGSTVAIVGGGGGAGDKSSGEHYGYANSALAGGPGGYAQVQTHSAPKEYYDAVAQNTGTCLAFMPMIKNESVLNNWVSYGYNRSNPDVIYGGQISNGQNGTEISWGSGAGEGYQNGQQGIDVRIMARTTIPAVVGYGLCTWDKNLMESTLKTNSALKNLLFSNTKTAPFAGIIPTSDRDWMWSYVAKNYELGIIFNTDGENDWIYGGNVYSYMARDRNLNWIDELKNDRWGKVKYNGTTYKFKGTGSNYGGYAGVFNTNDKILARFGPGNMGGGGNHYFYWSQAGGKDLGLSFDEQSEAEGSLRYKAAYYWPSTGGSSWYNASGALSGYTPKLTAGANSGDGYFRIASAEPVITGYEPATKNLLHQSPDKEAPNVVDANSVRFDSYKSDTVMTYVFDKPEDKGTNYYNIVEAYSQSNNGKLSTSNITKTEIKRGIGSYVYLVNGNATTNITPSTSGVKTTTTESVEIPVKTTVQYLHIIALDKNKNYSATVHVKIPAAQAQFPVHTTKLNVNSTVDGTLYKAGETTYVKADVPVAFGFTGYIKNPASDKYQVNRNRLVVDKFGTEGLDTYYVEDYAPNKVPFGSGDVKYNLSDIKTSSELSSLPAGKKAIDSGVTSVNRKNKSMNLDIVRNLTFVDEQKVTIYPRAGADYVKPATGNVVTTWSTDGVKNSAKLVIDGTAPVSQIEIAEIGWMPDGKILWQIEVTESGEFDSGVDTKTLKVEFIDEQNQSRGVYTLDSGIVLADSTEKQAGVIDWALFELETPVWLFKESPRLEARVSVMDNVQNGDSVRKDTYFDSGSKLITNTKYDGNQRNVTKSDVKNAGTQWAVRKPTDSVFNVNLDFAAPDKDVWTLNGSNKVTGDLIDKARTVPFKFIGYVDKTKLGLGSYTGKVDASGRYVVDGVTKNYTFPGQRYVEEYDAEYNIGNTYLPVMYRVGYLFNGWYDGAGKLVSKGGENYTPADHINLVAKWTPAWDLPITVYHYQEDLGKDTYTLESTQTVNNGPAWGSITVKNYAKSYTGFTYRCGSLTGGVNGPGQAVEYVDVSPNSATKLYLFYTRNKHNVTLTKDAGINSVTGAGVYEYGAKLDVSAVVRAGYNFKNWTGTYNSTNAKYSFTMPDKDVSMQANSNIITYTITYKLNGGTVTGNPKEYTVETPTFTLKTPTKPGWTFEGWSGTGLDGYVDEVTVQKGTTGNLVFEAHWSKPITLTQISGKVVNGNGTVNKQTYTLKDNETSHTFNLNKVTPAELGDSWYAVGWNDKDLKGSATPDYKLDGTLTLSNNKTVYAVYNRDAKFHYGIDSELIIDGKQHYTSDSSGWDDGVKVDIPSGGKDIPGWTQEGLTDDPNGHTKEWENTGTITGDKGPDFYEIYKRPLTIKYDKNAADATGTPPKNSIAEQTYNASGDISKPTFVLENNTFEREGYLFNGWQLLDVNKVYPEGAEYKDWVPAVDDPVTTITAKATWRFKEFYINYNAGTNWNTEQKSYKQTCKFTDTSTIATIKLDKNRFTRDMDDAGADRSLKAGYYFRGWTDTLGKADPLKDLDNREFTDEATVRFEAEPDRTYQLHPIWEKPIVLRLNLNGGQYKGESGVADNTIYVINSVFNNRKELTVPLTTDWSGLAGWESGKNTLGNQYKYSGGYSKPNNGLNLPDTRSKVSDLVDIYGEYDADTGFNNNFVKRDNNGNVYRFLGWSVNPDATVPDPEYDVFRTSHKEYMTLKDSTTLYAVWEQALALNVTIHRSLGDLTFSGIGASVTPSHKGSATVGNTKYITAIINPGEQGNYTVVASGNNSKQVAVKFDTRMTDIYDLEDNPDHTFKDNLNPSTSEDLTVNQKHGLNRLLRGTGGEKLEAHRKFYVPNYLGTKYAPDSSRPGVDDIANYKVYKVKFEAAQDSHFAGAIGNEKETAIVEGYIYVTRDAESGSGPDTPIDPDYPGESGKPIESKLKTRIKAR